MDTKGFTLKLIILADSPRPYTKSATTPFDLLLCESWKGKARSLVPPSLHANKLIYQDPTWFSCGLDLVSAPEYSFEVRVKHKLYSAINPRLLKCVKRCVPVRPISPLLIITHALCITCLVPVPLYALRYLLELDCDGDPAWECITNMHKWMLRLLFNTKEEFQGLVRTCESTSA